MRMSRISSFLIAGAIFVIQSPAAGASCKDLTDLQLPHTTITLAEPVPSGNFEAPDGDVHKVSGFCRVHGVAEPTTESNINFEVWMPLAGWNGRYHQIARYGLAGAIDYAGLADGVRKGYAVAATDDGHTDTATFTLWALNEPNKIIDFGYRALRETAEKSKTVIAAYYERPADYSYLVGLSRGGNQAMQGAQRFPQYWDGILAGCPVISWTGLMYANLSNTQPQVNGAAGHILPTKLPAIQKAALASCKAEAHVVDGIAADPRFCRYDPNILLCKSEENDDCLTGPQVATLKRIYDGPKNQITGQILYPGFEPTMEAETANRGKGMGGWIIHQDPVKTEAYQAADGFYRTMVFDDLSRDFSDIDLAQDFYFTESKSLKGQPLASVLNPSNTDLSAMQDAGGKLIMWIGWGDPAITPQSNIDYYEDVVENVGSLDGTRDFFRFYLVPGMLHCEGGPGPNTFGNLDIGSATVFPNKTDDPRNSMIAALEAWVENGRVPERVTATKYKDDDPAKDVSMTRPLCPYPQVSVYGGKGSTRDADSFVCRDGAPFPAH